MNKYLNAVSSNLIIFGVNIVFFLLITPIAMGVLGEEFYGLWAILHAIVQFAGIGTAGISSIVNKFASEANINSPEGHGKVITSGMIIVFILSIITALILISIKPIIINNIEISSTLYRTQFDSAILLTAISLIPLFLSRVFQGFLFSKLQHNLAKQIELYHQIALWGGIVILSIWQKNLILIGLWSLFLTFFVLAAYVISVRRNFEYHHKIDKTLIRNMLNFSGYLFVEQLSITMFQQLDVVIVGMIINPSIAGIYSVGTSIGVRLSSLIGQITEVMIPYASLKDSLNDREKLYKTFRKLSYYVSLLVALIGVAAIIWMNELLTLWISADYAQKYTMFYQILIIAYSFISLTRPAHQTLTGMGKVKITSITYFITTIFMFGTLYLLAARLGFLGAVLSKGVMFLLGFYIIHTYQILQEKVIWKDSLKDIGLGLFLPSVIFLIVFLIPGIFTKISLSVLFIAIFSIILIKDQWIIKELQNFFKSRSTHLS
ncbi:MAG: oligosaccharide flippase family protein [Candidatus Atribacteria bacterium]|nr:oligosaccharide flippase family protein [Candidatus Atribacteria bacterium]